MEQKTEFAYSMNGENFGSFTYESREEALKEAIEEENRGDSTIYVGEVCKPSLDEFFTTHAIDTFLEQMSCWAYDDYGEAAEDWLECSKKEVALLHDTLKKPFYDWVKKTKNEPEFWRVTEIKKHKNPHFKPLPQNPSKGGKE